LLATWDVALEGDLRFLGRDIRLGLGAAMAHAYAGDLREPDPVALAQRVAKEKGLDLTMEQAEELWRTWNLPGAFFGRRLFDDAIETLDTLRARGYRVGCVTNRPFSGPAFFEEVDSLGLTPHFDVMSVSADLGYMKPHPEIFQHALEGLGIEAAEAVMVGDSLRADVAGSQALGMTAVWRRHNAIDEEIDDGIEPDYEINHLRELLAIPPLDDGA
jgi:HAD superfamily hydrolase (TIGR01549 family)